MGSVSVLQRTLVSLAVVGFCLPQPALAAGADAGPTPRVIDVALARGGVLLGQVVDSQGTTLATVTVLFFSGDRRVAVAQTDAQGYFAVNGLRGGVYRVVAAGSQTTFRLWTPGHAPPRSRTGILLVGGRDTIRGQMPSFGALGFWLSNPWVLTGAAAAAVAVPIAVHNAQRPSSP